MRQVGANPELPRSPGCSLSLQVAESATTTHTVRSIGYITNGFGGPLDSFKPDPIQAYVERAVAGYDVPVSIVKAAIITYTTLGPSGFTKTLAFVDAIEDAEHAIVRMFPNLRNQLRGSMAGAAYKRAFNSVLNTAASRIGLTPLSSAIVAVIRERLSRIPDSSTDPKSQFNAIAPSYIRSMRLWVGHLNSGIS